MAARAIETLQEIREIQAEVFRALTDQQFDRLNAVAARLRTSKERLADGRWKLPFVVSGVLMDLRRRDTEGWRLRLALIDKWTAQTPNDPLPHLTKAEALIAYAWDARGDNSAASVKEADWPIFRERIAQARAVLETSAAISKQTPLWYEAMLRIGTAQGWSEQDFLRVFQAGVREEPTYYSFYFTTARHLLPRWHGSAQEVARFVDAAVAATRQQEGQTLYARIYWSLLWALNDQTFAPGYADWPRMRAGFEDIVRSYPDNWNLNAFTYYACMAKDWPTARRIGAKLTSVAVELWRDPATYETCMRQNSPERDRDLKAPKTMISML